MKKITILVACVSLVGLSSCFKKERTCTCTTKTTNSNGNVTTSEPHVTTYKKIRKGDAKDQCSNYTYEDTYTQGSNTSTYKSEVTCELK